jgi:endogenous inhibitor of DNA gyrase (YacG/DUF329 family)
MTCPVCGTPVERSGRRLYCSEACRVAAFRRRHADAALAPPRLPPGTPRRSVSVYVCPSCDARYLGQQRCDACNVFCRSAGPGGRCPACDEPVGYEELER